MMATNFRSQAGTAQRGNFQNLILIDYDSSLRELEQRLFNCVFTEMNEQIQEACIEIKAVPVFSKAPIVNMMASSQGSMITRGIVQKCTQVMSKNLIHFGGPNAGVSEYPLRATSLLCQIIKSAINQEYYWWFAQDLISPTEYWRDYSNLTDFMKYSIFLPDFNNLKEQKNPDYKKQITSLDHLVLF